ncbi:MAG TPA: hypothetical protein VEM13_00990 [Gemmatimonadales bacterium]|nr:hypothetical protein [Gemmatimonadales bacterium]
MTCSLRAIRVAAAAFEAALLCGCTNPMQPDFPLTLRLRLVNNVAGDTVYVAARGDESLYPGLIVPPSDSGCSDVYAFADSAPVEVRSWRTGGLYGASWIYPARSLGWHTVASATGIDVAPSGAC